MKKYYIVKNNEKNCKKQFPANANNTHFSYFDRKGRCHFEICDLPRASLFSGCIPTTVFLEIEIVFHFSLKDF